MFIIEDLFRKSILCATWEDVEEYLYCDPSTRSWIHWGESPVIMAKMWNGGDYVLVRYNNPASIGA